MAIQLKNDNSNDDGAERITDDFVEEYSKFRGGIGDGTVDIDKINDLPAYTGPSVIPGGSTGLNSGKKKRNIISLIIVGAILIAVAFFIYKGAMYMTSSSGKDITDKLTMTEEELSKDMGVTFEENADKVRSIYQYSNGTVTVKSAEDLNIVYINGKQVGINTTSRKYRFYDIGINDPNQTVQKKTSYKYENYTTVLSDVIGGNSDVYIYYNTQNNDCLFLIISKNTNRVVNMTYYTDCDKVMENLSRIGE